MRFILQNGGPTTTTVLFTDVVGSTEARTRLGEDTADRLRRIHDRLVTQAVEANRGRVVKNLGDGLMAVFGATSDALTAAVAAQRALARHHSWRGAEPRLEVRMGISVGDVVFEEADCFGTPVVEAARLCDAAGGGQILASEIVCVLGAGRGGHRFTPAGSLDLKGLAGPLNAAEVEWKPEGGLGLPLPAGLDQPWTFPFVGREKEFDQLLGGWREAQAGARHVAVVAGEPGIGKTRLTGELARRAIDEGGVVLYGRCPDGLGVPYQAFAEVVRTYSAACPPERLEEQLGPLGGELVRLAPALPELFPGLPEPLRAEPETERYRLFEAVAGLLEGIWRSAPVLLILDDLHWAALPDLALLRHLLRPGEAGRLFVVGTYRDSDVDSAHPLAPLLSDLRRDPRVDRLTLSGIDEGAVALMLESAGHVRGAVGPALARAIHAETDGNPFFTGEVIRHVAESDGPMRKAGDAAIEQAFLELGLPEGVVDVVGQRLARLSTTTREFLGTAAVIGREFDIGILIDAGEASPDAVLDALERSEEARLVAPLRGRTDRYAFAHSIVRSACYDALAGSRRARLHRRVGEALERRGQDDDLPDLAHHFHAAGPAGDPGRAVEFAARAGQQASTRLAYEQAAAYYGLALEAVSWAGSDLRERRRRILLDRAEAWRRAGDVDQARQSFLAAADEARRISDPDIVAGAALGLGEVADVWGVDPVLTELLTAALDAVGDDQQALRARLLARLGQGLYYADPDQHLELSGRAVEEARKAGDPAALAAVLRARHIALSGPDGLVERKKVADEIVQLAEAAGETELALHGYGWRFVDLLELGDRDGADRDLAAHAELAQSLRQPLHLRDAAQWRATMATLEGRFGDAARAIEEAFVLGQQAHDSHADMTHLVQHTWLLIDAERLEELPAALPPVRRLIDAVPASVAPAWRAPFVLLLAMSGDEEAATDEFGAIVDGCLGALPRDAAWLPCLLILASACHELRDRERADVLYERLLPYAGRVLVPDRAWTCRGAVSHYLGVLAALAARPDEARPHLEAAIELHERLRAQPMLARTRYEYAEALFAQQQPGDLPAVEHHAAGALETARALNLPRLSDRAADLLRRAARTTR